MRAIVKVHSNDFIQNNCFDVSCLVSSKKCQQVIFIHVQTSDVDYTHSKSKTLRSFSFMLSRWASSAMDIL